MIYMIHVVKSNYEFVFQEFCTSSLKGEVAVETGQTAQQSMDILQRNEILEEKKWHWR